MNYDLILGDCLEKMKEIEDKSVDCVIVDPPYGQTSLKWDNVINFNLLWHEYDRITKKSASICIFS